MSPSSIRSKPRDSANPSSRRLPSSRQPRHREGRVQGLPVSVERLDVPPLPEHQRALRVQELRQQLRGSRRPRRLQRLCLHGEAVLEPVLQPQDMRQGGLGTRLEPAVAQRARRGEGALVVRGGIRERPELLQGGAAGDAGFGGDPRGRRGVERAGRPERPLVPPDRLRGRVHAQASVPRQRGVSRRRGCVARCICVVGQYLGELVLPAPHHVLAPQQDPRVRLGPPRLRDPPVRHVAGEDVVEDELALAVDRGPLPPPDQSLVHQGVQRGRNIVGGHALHRALPEDPTDHRGVLEHPLLVDR